MRYGLYPAKFNGSGLSLSQVASVASASGRSAFVVRPGGSLDPAANILSSARPVARLMTHDLATVLGTVSLTVGYDCSSASQLNFQQRAVAGSFTAAASSAHVTQSIASGFLMVTEISAAAESNDPAQCQLEFVALSSDGTNPITDAHAGAINGQPSPAYNSVFYHGPVYSGSTQLTGLVSTSVRPGINYMARIADGNVFPRRAASSIQSRQPVIELVFLSLSHINQYLDNSIMAPFTDDLTVYFQKGTIAAGGRVAAGTAEHIAISATAGSYGPDDITVQETEDATFKLTIMPTGTLAMSAASTIPSS